MDMDLPKESILAPARRYEEAVPERGRIFPSQSKVSPVARGYALDILRPKIRQDACDRRRNTEQQAGNSLVGTGHAPREHERLTRQLGCLARREPAWRLRPPRSSDGAFAFRAPPGVVLESHVENQEREPSGPHARRCVELSPEGFVELDDGYRAARFSFLAKSDYLHQAPAIELVSELESVLAAPKRLRERTKRHAIDGWTVKRGRKFRFAVATAILAGETKPSPPSIAAYSAEPDELSKLPNPHRSGHGYPENR